MVRIILVWILVSYVFTFSFANKCLVKSTSKSQKVNISGCTSERELRLVLVSHRYKPIKTLILSNFSFNNFDPETFIDIQAERLVLKNFGLKNLRETSFKGLEAFLKALILIDPSSPDGVDHWNYSAFHNFTLLERVALGHKGVKGMILPESFSCLPSKKMKWVQITGCCIEFFESYLVNFNQLEYLSLEGNELREIARENLPNPAEELATLDLSNNLLFYINDDVFKDLPKLNKVILDNNQLKTLNPLWFDEFGEVFKFYVYDNPIMCDSSLIYIVNHVDTIGDDEVFFEDGKRPLLCTFPTDTLGGQRLRSLHIENLTSYTPVQSAPFPFADYTYSPFKLCTSLSHPTIV